MAATGEVGIVDADVADIVVAAMVVTGDLAPALATGTIGRTEETLAEKAQVAAVIGVAVGVTEAAVSSVGVLGVSGGVGENGGAAVAVRGDGVKGTEVGDFFFIIHSRLHRLTYNVTGLRSRSRPVDAQ